MAEEHLAVEGPHPDEPQVPLTPCDKLQLRCQFQVGHPLPDDILCPPVDLVHLFGGILHEMDLVMALDHPHQTNERRGIDVLRLGEYLAVALEEIYRQDIQLHTILFGSR